MFPPPVPFVPPQFGIKLAAEAWECAASAALRQRAIAAGRRSIMAFQITRADSYAGLSGASSSPCN